MQQKILSTMQLKRNDRVGGNGSAELWQLEKRQSKWLVRNLLTGTV